MPNAITVMLAGDTDVPTVSIHVIDVASEVELASLRNVPIDIAV